MRFAFHHFYTYITQKINMALSYIGGKSRIGKWIVNYYPQDMETYVETFGGMYWCYFNMDFDKYPNLKKVVYNDFNPLNYNLFLCLKTNHNLLLNAINDISCQEKGVEDTDPVYKEKFKNFQSELFGEGFEIEGPNYQVAAKYAYIVTQVFSGSKPETSNFIDLKGKYKSKYLTFRDKLTNQKWIDKFLRITEVENLDFAEVVEKYDGPNTYFYLDPPYWKTENYYSNHDFDVKDHDRLANLLHTVIGKFSLSYYDFSILHQWYPEDQYNWVKKSFKKAAAAKKGVTQNDAEELLIMNY